MIPPRSEHPGGVCIGMGDGVARFISDSVAILTFQRLGAAADGAAVNGY